MKPVRTLILALLAILLTTASVARAGYWTSNFSNDFASDQIYLFLVSGDVTFDRLNVQPSGWIDEIGDPGKTMSLSGPLLPAGDADFTVRFYTPGSGRAAYTLEWAELAGGSVLGSGSLIYNGSSFATSPIFTSTIPTPLPGSVWLLVTGLAAFVGIRRRIVH